MAKKHYTEWGKVFARLRIMYSETLKQQSQSFTRTTSGHRKMEAIMIVIL